MTDDQIKFLLTLPPEQIVKWFQSKGLITTWKWNDLWQEAHNKSFTVAKVMKLDILQDLKDEVDKIFSSGITFDQIRKNLEPELKNLGWWGKVKASDVPGYDPSSGIDPNSIVQLGSAYRLNTIYTTNANVGYGMGRYDMQTQNTIERPYWQYKQIQRLHKNIDHSRYADKVFMWNDPIWNEIYPPTWYNCGCYVLSLNKAEVEALGIKVWNGDNVSVIDQGCGSSPIATAFKPDLTKYDNDLVNAYKNSK